MRSHQLLCLLVTVVASAFAPIGVSAESQIMIVSRLLATDNRAGDSSTLVTDDAESAALSLVRNELPQLQRVLDRLRSDSPSQYAKAVRDISRSAKRLESMRVGDEVLYGHELELLKSRTSISLLVARLKVRDNDPDRKSLKVAIQELHEAELSRAKYEVDAIEKRLQRSEEQLRDAQTRLSKKSVDLDKRLDNAYFDYLRKAGRSADGSTIKKRLREKGQSE